MRHDEKGTEMIVCDKCKLYGKTARPLILMIGLRNPPKPDKPHSSQPLIQHHDIKPIDLCDDCAKDLIAIIRPAINGFTTDKK